MSRWIRRKNGTEIRLERRSERCCKKHDAISDASDADVEEVALARWQQNPDTLLMPVGAKVRHVGHKLSKARGTRIANEKGEMKRC